MEYPKRKPNRLTHYDYSEDGAYFITICTKNKQALLSEISIGDVVGADIIRPKLTKYGYIVNTAINAITSHYPSVKVDRYVIMPDHIHLILMVSNNNTDGRILSAPTKTITTVIGQMKRWVSKKSGISLWQKSYYDHIIRNEEDYISKCVYIENNPAKWFEKEESKR